MRKNQKAENLPILRFENQEHVNECAKYWIEKLGLRDWIIRIDLISEPHEDGVAGLTYTISTERSAKIELFDMSPMVLETCPSAVCQEQTLVHELLHCVFNNSMRDYSKGDNFFEKVYSENLHRDLDCLARSFIMVRYGLTLDYFKSEGCL